MKDDPGERAVERRTGSAVLTLPYNIISLVIILPDANGHHRSHQKQGRAVDTPAMICMDLDTATPTTTATGDGQRMVNND